MWSVACTIDSHPTTSFSLCVATKKYPRQYLFRPLPIQFRLSSPLLSTSFSGNSRVWYVRNGRAPSMSRTLYAPLYPFHELLVARYYGEITDTREGRGSKRLSPSLLSLSRRRSLERGSRARRFPQWKKIVYYILAGIKWLVRAWRCSKTQLSRASIGRAVSSMGNFRIVNVSGNTRPVSFRSFANFREFSWISSRGLKLKYPETNDNEFTCISRVPLNETLYVYIKPQFKRTVSASLARLNCSPNFPWKLQRAVSGAARLNSSSRHYDNEAKLEKALETGNLCAH